MFVDDGSPGDYRIDLEPFKGMFNIQYVLVDSWEHPVVKELNPDGKPLYPPFDEPLKYHTPALTHNIGFRVSRGKALFITQPDILQAEDNLRVASSLPDNKFFFGRVRMSGTNFRERVLSTTPESLAKISYHQLIRWPDHNSGYKVRPWEYYWFVSSIPRKTAHKIRGVEEDYMAGVFAEDDEFRERAKLAGCPPTHSPQMDGIHIDHSQLSGHHDRSGERWQRGASRNRNKWVAWKRSDDKEAQGNKGREWGSLEYVKTHECWTV